MMKKALLVFVLFLTPALYAAQVVEAIVIRVGDRIITRTQYTKRLGDVLHEIEQTVPADQQAERKDRVRKNLVNDLIGELLVKDRADRIGITVSEEEIKDAVARLKTQYGISTDEQFEESLRQSGLTRAEMELRLRDTLITNKLFGKELRSRSELTDRELRERYEREKETFRVPERAKLREIVVLKPANSGAEAEARERATQIAAQARAAGADFAKLASTHSESGTKERGGDLGEVARGELLADLDKTVFNSTAGTVVGPIETRAGWHILKVESRLPSEIPAFESIKDKLRKDASDDAFQRDFKAYIDQLRRDAFIQIHEANVPTT